MPQPIEVKSQAEQQSLPHLYGRDATRCFGRELTFDHREDRILARGPYNCRGKARYIW